MGTTDDNSKEMDIQQQQTLHRKQKGSCSKTRTVSSLVPHTQSNFPWRKGNYRKVENPLMSRVKSVQRSMQAPTFLSLIEIDLMDFRKCSCDCEVSHMWFMNITDHHTKHVALYPLTAKSGENVLDALQQHCYTY